MSTLWSPSRVEMRTAWLEEHGIGACSGREYHLARKKKPRENMSPSLTGTFPQHPHAKTHLCFLLCFYLPSLPICPILHCVLLCTGSSPCLCVVTGMAVCILPPTSCTPPLHFFSPCVLYAWPHNHSVRTVCTVPLIDSIHGQTFNIEPQGGGDSDGFARGAWDWSMLWKRVPLGDREKKMRKTRSEPYRYRNLVPLE